MTTRLKSVNVVHSCQNSFQNSLTLIKSIQSNPVSLLRIAPGRRFTGIHWHWQAPFVGLNAVLRLCPWQPMLQPLIFSLPTRCMVDLQGFSAPIRRWTNASVAWKRWQSRAPRGAALLRPIGVTVDKTKENHGTQESATHKHTDHFGLIGIPGHNPGNSGGNDRSSRKLLPESGAGRL